MATKIWIGTGAAPNDWTHPDNWSPSGVPAGGDHVYFENSSVSCNTTTELDQSGVNLGSLNIDQSYTGELGAAGTPLQSQTPILNIGYHNGPGTPSGAPLINIDLGADPTDITVRNTGTSSDSSKAAVRLKGSSTANDLILYKGKVSFGTDTDDIGVSKLRTVTVTYDTKISSDADLFIGELSAVVTTLNILGGDVYLKSGATTVTMKAGTLYTTGGGALATVNVNGGAFTSNSTGTIATLNIFDGDGTVDFTRSNTVRTVTTLTLDPGGAVSLDDSVMTLTNNIKPYTPARNVTFSAS